MIFKRELLRNRKSLIIWSIILVGLILMTLSIYPQFAEQQESMEELLKAYPESMKKAFGMDTLSMGSLIGYYGIQVYFMTTLLGSIYAVMLAADIVAKEENEKTIEFLLAKPISRSQILTEKLLAVFINVVILNLVIVLVSLVGFQFSEQDIAMKSFLLLSIAQLLLHLSFAALAFLLSAIMKKTRTIVSVSLGIVLLSYLLSMVSGISDQLEFLQYVSFFKYVDAADIIPDNTIKPLYLVIMTVVIIGSISATYLFYRKKDIAV
ncbi:ABC transporter permease subunit [Metabacillus herbersteinensis]|uniref:ABC transporter permease subunit n=1 Tax=Metabacillus herbersteinensis TaxID=283816 RepID=A0ABV6GFV9_9BACI